MSTASGELLRKIRELSGKTQAEVAAAMGCVQPNISRWEHGGGITVNSVAKFMWACDTQLTKAEALELFAPPSTPQVPPTVGRLRGRSVSGIPGAPAPPT